MLQSLSGGGSRCARRALVFAFAWGLVMIAALQFRHGDNAALESSQQQQQQRDVQSTLPGKPVVNSRYDDHVDVENDELGGRRGVGGSSRYLLQRLTIEPTPSYVAAGRIAGAGASGSREEPLVDRREPRTEEELVREIESRLPSLPLAYWLKTSLDNGGKRAPGSRSRNAGKNSPADKEKSPANEKENTKRNGRGCVPRFPSIFDLEFNNIYWQTLRSTNGTFQLFGAYYDERRLSRIGPAIRIVGMIDRIEPRVRTYCQMWFDGDREPAVIETLEYKYVWYSKWGNYKQGIYQPYVIACKVPQSHWKRGPPASVSIVERACDTSTNNLRVIYNKPDVKKGFAVCVKGLDFLHDDLSVRLVEWIELIGLLGADKIYFYQLQVHPNVSKVLDHYAKLGKIEVTPLTLPGGQPNVPAFQHMYLTKKTNNKRQNELIPYNDCLYKHMYEYEYIALLDVDEVIMPLRDSTWPELMKRVLPKALAIRNETRASYNVRNVYFLDDLLHSHGSFDHLPRYMHMLQHVYRSKNFTKPNQYVKCFHNPERVVTLHNHFPLACLGAGCTSYPIETEDAQLQHYRADCVKSLKKTCLQYRENSVMDTTIWRYKDRLVERVTETLERLGFFGVS